MKNAELSIDAHATNVKLIDKSEFDICERKGYISVVIGVITYKDNR